MLITGVVAGGFLIGAGLILVVTAGRLRRRGGMAGGGHTAACLAIGLVIARTSFPADQTGCGPPPVLPESPLSVLLPVAAAAVFAAAWLVSRRRLAGRTTA